MAQNQTIATRLALLQKQHGLIDVPKKSALTDEVKEVTNALELESTMDLDHINTRASLYVFLNSLVLSIGLSYFGEYPLT